MLIDSHCHLNYLDDPDAALARARDEGVEGLLCIGVDESSIGEVLQLAAQHRNVWASVGQHPESAHGDPSWITHHVDADSVVAIGETGLDYFHEQDTERQRTQRTSFAAHLEIAEAHALPVIIHTRAAEGDTLDVLRARPDVRGVLHCFTESWDMAKAALDLGYFISISGIVTFKNGATVRDVAGRVPLDRLLVETDAPWLAPVPYRGMTNEPAFVRETAATIAGLRNIPLDELAAATTENFHSLFGVSA